MNKETAHSRLNPVVGIEEFELFANDSQKMIEAFLINLSSVRTGQNLLLSAVNCRPLIQEFEKLINVARKDLEHGSLRMGMRVQADKSND